MDRISADKLIQDVHTVVVDAEGLLKATASETGERIERARARAIESLVDTPERADLLSHRGRTWARKYRWDTHAATLRDVYAELATEDR